MNKQEFKKELFNNLKELNVDLGQVFRHIF